MKFMAKDKNCELNIAKLSSGNFSNSGGETVAEMLRVHFPNSRVVTGSTCPINLPTINCGKDKLTIAKKIVMHDRVVWTVMSFKPFKSPGLDGIFPALLQNSIKVLALCFAGFLKRIAYRHISTAWRHSKVIFIPKLFRPISLSSFLLKTVENTENYIFFSSLQNTG